jgi:outer membrane protein TolC
VAVLLVLPAGGAPAAQPLSLAQVLEGALAHYPEVRAAWEARRAGEGRLTASAGAFDWRFEQKGYGRFSGYYDGRVLDSKLVKPLPYANARLFGGYSISDGAFPVYEDEFATLDNGEVKVGFLLSLLRDRSIDERRFQVAESRLAIERAELDLAATRILVQHSAASAYLAWIAAGQVLDVQRDLLVLAEKRQSFLEAAVREGNAPAISLEENRQNLLERQARLIEAEREMVDRAQALSLFLRDAAGQPRVPSPDELPPSLPQLPDVEPADVEAALEGILERRPEAALLDNARALEEQKLRMGENALLPRVDLGYELKRDFGSGDESRERLDNILGLQVEIPLERRLGEGRMAEARANLDRLAWQQRLLEDRIRIEIESLANEIRAARALVATTAEQVERAAAVERGERERLEAGASQIFLVNAREEATANARVKLVAARVRRQQSLADFHAAAVRLDRFYPDGEVPAFAPRP